MNIKTAAAYEQGTPSIRKQETNHSYVVDPYLSEISLYVSGYVS